MEPTGDWRWIATGASRIHEHAAPRRHVDVTSRSPNDLIDLGHALMEAGDKALAIDFSKRFVLYRDGLLIAFLAQRPLRIGEAAAICLGRQLQKRGGSWHLAFEGEEMKNGRPYEASWPSTLAPALERYLEIYRAVVVTNNPDQPHGGGLWLSQFGTRTAPSCLGYRVEHRTREAFGKHLNPHLLRKLAASLIADYAPDKITDAARLLGHADLRVTEKHYIKANCARAVQRHQQVVKQHR